MLGPAQEQAVHHCLVVLRKFPRGVSAGVLGAAYEDQVALLGQGVLHPHVRHNGVGLHTVVQGDAGDQVESAFPVDQERVAGDGSPRAPGIFRVGLDIVHLSGCQACEHFALPVG